MRKFFVLLGPTLLLAGCAGMPSGPAPTKPDAQADAFSTYLSARFAAQQHDMPQAARYYAQSLKSDPGNADLLSLAFFYSSTAGDLDAAAAYAAKVVEATPDDRAARLALAVAAFRHKDYAGVRKQLAASGKGPFTVLTVSLFDGFADCGILNFHRDFFTPFGYGPMNLSQRGRCERFRFKRSKHFFRILAKRALELRPHQGRVHRRRLHLQPGQFFHDVRIEVPPWSASEGSFLVYPTRPVAIAAHASPPPPGRYLFHEKLVTAAMDLVPPHGDVPRPSAHSQRG